jgi:hypothetical protein
MGSVPPPAAGGFDESRFKVYARVQGIPSPVSIAMSRSSTGIQIAQIQVPEGLGGSRLTVGATFDGVDVVEPKTLPIATDHWNADYMPVVAGGCAVAALAERAHPRPASSRRLMLWAAATLFLGAARVRQRSTKAAAKTPATRM